MIKYWKKRPVRVFIFIAILLFPVLGIFVGKRTGDFAEQLGNAILCPFLGFVFLQICFTRSLRYAAGTGRIKSFFIGLIPLTIASVFYTVTIGSSDKHIHTVLFPDDWVLCGFIIGVLEAATFPLIVGMVRRSRYNRILDER